MTQQAASEAAQLADIVIAPQTGPEAVAGLTNRRPGWPSGRSLTWCRRASLSVTAGCTATCGWICRLTLRTGRSGRWRLSWRPPTARAAKQKAALTSCHHHCRTAILMLLSGLDAWHARELLTKHHDHLRLALREAQRSAVTPPIKPVARRASTVLRVWTLLTKEIPLFYFPRQSR